MSSYITALFRATASVRFRKASPYSSTSSKALRVGRLRTFRLFNRSQSQKGRSLRSPFLLSSFSSTIKSRSAIPSMKRLLPSLTLMETFLGARFLRVSVVLLLFLPAALSQSTPKTYDCVRAKKPLVIDGKLDDSAWNKAPWTSDFVDIEGDAKPAPRFRTRMKMLWDDNYLYVGAELEEPDIQAKLTEHD